MDLLTMIARTMMIRTGMTAATMKTLMLGDLKV